MVCIIDTILLNIIMTNTSRGPLKYIYTMCAIKLSQRTSFSRDTSKHHRFIENLADQFLFFMSFGKRHHFDLLMQYTTASFSLLVFESANAINLTLTSNMQ